jgi:hypothetical protein
VVVVAGGPMLADRGAVESLTRRYVAAIENVAGLPARVQPLDVSDPHRVDEDPLGPLTNVGAVLLIHTRLEQARRAQAMVNVPVLTDQDAIAIALTAALLTTLTRAGRSPQSSRVVIAGAKTMPVLCPLLMLAGIGDITNWNPGDAPAFPLRHVTAGADAVIDLLGGTAPFVPHPAPVLVVPSEGDALLALPGLLRVLTRIPDARPSVEVLLACALVLVMATRPDEQLPRRSDRILAARVAEAATQAFHPSHNTSSGQPVD